MESDYEYVENVFNQELTGGTIFWMFAHSEIKGDYNRILEENGILKIPEKWGSAEFEILLPFILDKQIYDFAKRMIDEGMAKKWTMEELSMLMEDCSEDTRMIWANLFGMELMDQADVRPPELSPDFGIGKNTDPLIADKRRKESEASPELQRQRDRFMEIEGMVIERLEKLFNVKTDED